MERDVGRESNLQSAPRAFRWGTLWGGLFVVAGIQILMQLFGIAVGISALRPSMGAVHGVSIWLATWTMLSTCAAFFAGGWFVGSADDSGLARATAVRSGIAIWALALTIGIFVTPSGILGAVDLARALLLRLGTRGGFAVGNAIAAAWATFATVLVALGCAIGGAAMGVSRPLARRKERARRHVITGPIVPTTP